MTLYQLVSARPLVLLRFARWAQIELPRRQVRDTAERYHLRVAHCVHYALTVRECEPFVSEREERDRTAAESGDM